MGEIKLKWKDHDKELSNKLWEYFLEEYLVDISIICHGKHMKIHKFVLAFIFPTLKESIRSMGTIHFDKEEGIDSTVTSPLCLNLDHVMDHAEDMEYLFQFAYTGKVTVPKEHADCLMRIAVMFKLNSLEESLSQWKNKEKTPDEAKLNDNTSLSRLRPRTQLKRVKFIDENFEKFTSDDDCVVDNPAIIDHDYCLNNVKVFDGFSNGTDKKIKKRRPKKKKIRRQNKITQKSEDDFIKGIGSIQMETPQKVTKTEFDIEAIDEIQLQEETTTTTSTNTETKKTEILKCDQCDFIAKYPFRLKRHLKSHAWSQGRKRRFTTRSKGAKTLKCDHCDFIALFPSKLRRHMKIHSRQMGKDLNSDKPFFCDSCADAFETEILLEEHRVTNSCIEYFVCEYCGHKTRQKTTLIQHLASVHQVDKDRNPLEKNIKCTECTFSCYTNVQLSAHMRAKHTHLGKCKCKECNYTAPFLSQLQRHVRQTHRNIRNFVCEECGSRFHSQGHVNRHVLSRHKGLKRYKCNICSAEYSDTLCFKIHMQRHEGKVEYKYVCHICGHNLMKKNRLRSHLKNKHGMELEVAETDPTQLIIECEPTSEFMHVEPTCLLEH